MDCVRECVGGGLKLTESQRPRTTTTFDIKSKPLYTQIFPIDAFDRFLFAIELPSAIQEGRAGRALNREGQHHAHRDQIIFGLFAARHELRVKIGGDVFVQDLALAHGFFLLLYRRILFSVYGGCE